MTATTCDGVPRATDASGAGSATRISATLWSASLFRQGCRPARTSYAVTAHEN